MVVVDAGVGCPLGGADDEGANVVTELLDVVALAYHPRVAVSVPGIVSHHLPEIGISKIDNWQLRVQIVSHGGTSRKEQTVKVFKCLFLYAASQQSIVPSRVPDAHITPMNELGQNTTHLEL